tara:strand:- start:1842 stop:2606 length:765 start_codon:yes stop_codon:yes gene_type:complete
MESRNIKGKKHFVYDNIGEFHEHHSKSTKVQEEWRDAKEGDWVYSDDGRIIQILKRSGIKHPNDRKNYRLAKGYCRTVVGTFLCNDKTKMDTDFSSHPNRYTFSKKIKNTNSRIREREKATKKEKQFAVNMVVGKDAVQSYMEAFNEDNRTTAKKKAAVLLKQRRVMSEIEKSVLDVAKEMGVDHEYILRSMKQLIEHTDDENVALQGLKELGKAIGTLGGVKKVETGVVGLFQGFAPEQIEGAKRKLADKNEV